MTKHIASILERFAMPLEESEPGAEPWYADWAIKNPRKISDSITVGWYAYNSLLSVYNADEISSVWEPFGGLGAQSLIIRDLFRPRKHVVGEYTDAAVAHLRRALPRGTQVLKADAYETTYIGGFDLVGLDFGDLTCWKTRPDLPHRRLLDQVFETIKPKAVVLTDVAAPRLHLHATRYEALLGTGACASYETYLPALADLFRDMYGYTTIAGFYHRGAAKMAMVPEDLGDPGIFVPVPPSPIGLEIM